MELSYPPLCVAFAKAVTDKYPSPILLPDRTTGLLATARYPAPCKGPLLFQQQSPHLLQSVAVSGYLKLAFLSTLKHFRSALLQMQ